MKLATNNAEMHPAGGRRRRRALLRFHFPMMWDSSDHSDYRVVEYTGWRILSNYGTFEERSGVYIFANRGLHAKYVGKAGPRRMVVEIQSAIN